MLKTQKKKIIVHAKTKYIEGFKVECLLEGAYLKRYYGLWSDICNDTLKVHATSPKDFYILNKCNATKKYHQEKSKQEERWQKQVRAVGYFYNTTTIKNTSKPFKV